MSARSQDYRCRRNALRRRRYTQPSDIDVSFPAGAEDSDLLSALQQVLPSELKGHRPDLVLYGERLAGSVLHVELL